MLEPVVWWTPETTGAATIARRAVPDAASHDPVGALLGPFRIDHFIVRITPKPVLAPLLDITVHVIEPPDIGLFPSYRLNHVIRVTTIPADGIQVIITVTLKFGNIAVGKSGGASRPAGIFPFGLCRKSILVGSFFLVEFPDESLRILP